MTTAWEQAYLALRRHLADGTVPPGAHLAAALGKPVWLLVPFSPDFRWLLDREDSPWDPSMRLFRQQHPGDWGGVITRIHQALLA